MGVRSGIWPLAAIEGATAVFALCMVVLRRRLPYSAIAHATFWVVFVFFWFTLLFLEGISRPFGSVVQNWFIVLLVAVALVFFEDRRLFRRVYIVLCLGSYAIGEFALVQIRPLVAVQSLIPSAAGTGLLMQLLSLVLMVYVFVADIGEAERQLSLANTRLEDLIANMLPRSISERLRREGRTFADGFAECSVLFADIVGFTPLSASVPPRDLVRLLDELFSRFDELTGDLGLEKIKTIGDAYLHGCRRAAGSPTRSCTGVGAPGLEAEARRRRI